ncbi:pyrimidodiazepine synthase-like [Palaemon carinicauda]|uniref:pyrimidodiazepine synthase-like n=1 Tax=Palaemon carinicauda TaxID=392227 RepID=UPI0035B59B83
MSSEHLTVGSVCPPETPGLLRCYCMRFCPYCERLRLVLIAKNIKHEIVNIHLNKKPEWFVEKNPLQKVPTLELDGKLMFESLVSCDYLDEAYPENPLHKKDPWDKGQDRIFMELFSKVSSPMYRVYRSHVQGEAEEKKKAFEEIHDGLDLFETELSKRGTKYFGGNKPGMLDYMIWPWGERLPVIELMLEAEFEKSRFPKMKTWMDDMKEDPAVKAIFISPEVHKTFLEGAFSGNPDYDMKI